MVNRSEFDQAIWPHVKRKVELIQEMLTATSDIRHDFSGPIVPRYVKRSGLTLVAGPSRSGLIDGRMDWERPVFYVNAVTYAGLVGATEIAERLGKIREEDTWRHASAELQQAWQNAFSNRDWIEQIEDERTAISGL